MPVRIRNIRGFVIDTYISPCAHICRYCHVADRTYSSIPIARLITLFDRFNDWKTTQRLENLTIYFSLLGPSWNFDAATLATLLEFQRRIDNPFRCIMLGGLKMLPDDEMREWLRVRRDLGIDSVGVAMAGHGLIHDRWNGRKGDFEFLMRTQRLAREVGLEVHQWLFAVKSTLPILDEAAEILDSFIGPPTQRHARLFLSSGYGAYHEEERITESDLDHLPAWVVNSLKAREPLHPEWEWIDLFRNDRTPLEEDILLHLYVNDKNIDRIEEMSCEEIFADLERRTRPIYAELPNREQLCETFGDPKGTKIYEDSMDIEIAWLDRYLDKHPLNLEWSLIRNRVGKAGCKPPPPPLIYPEQKKRLYETIPSERNVL
jgi:hypothetical protein